MVSSPTRGSEMRSAVCAYAIPSCANCTSISGLGSAMAPASISTAGVGCVGRTTARAGRVTPGSGRSRICAVATIAPVEPADMTAATSPRRTSWHATAMLDRGLRQLASAPSSMASESSAGTMCTLAGAPCLASSGRSRPGRPVSAMWVLSWRAASTAPATISPGAWSPPIASTAMSLCREAGTGPLACSSTSP